MDRQHGIGTVGREGARGEGAGDGCCHSMALLDEEQLSPSGNTQQQVKRQVFLSVVKPKPQQ